MGPIYFLPFALCGLFGGNLAKSNSRKKFLVASIILASLTVGISGLDNPFSVFIGMRVLQGAISSTIDPVAFSMIPDLFPADKRSIANTFMASAGLFAEGVGSFSIIIIEKFGW